MSDEWYKKDSKIQSALLMLVKANVILSNTKTKELAKPYNEPQQEAKNIIFQLDNVSMSFEHLKNSNTLFYNMYSAVKETIKAVPLRHTDLYNIKTDMIVLINTFASASTIIKVQHLLDKSNMHTIVSIGC